MMQLSTWVTPSIPFRNNTIGFPVSRMNALIDKNYRVEPFRDLTTPPQLAIVYYIAVDGSAWDVLYDVPSHPDPDVLRAALTLALPKYVETFGSCEFGHLEIATETLQSHTMADEELADAFSSWEQTPIRPSQRGAGSRACLHRTMACHAV